MGGEREGQGGLGRRSEEEIGGELGLLSEEEVEQRQSSGLQVFIEARYTKRQHIIARGSPGVNKASWDKNAPLETLLSNQKHLISLPAAPPSNLWPENELKAAPGPILPPSISRRTWESKMLNIMIGLSERICPRLTTSPGSRLTNAVAEH